MAGFFAFRMALAWLASVCPLGPWRLIVSPLYLYAYHFLRIHGGLGRCRWRWMNGSLSGIMGLFRMVRVWEDVEGPGNLEATRRKAFLPSFNVNLKSVRVYFVRSMSDPKRVILVTVLCLNWPRPKWWRASQLSSYTAPATVLSRWTMCSREGVGISINVYKRHQLPTLHSFVFEWPPICV
jgi:hypothetical protein